MGEVVCQGDFTEEGAITKTTEAIPRGAIRQGVGPESNECGTCCTKYGRDDVTNLGGGTTMGTGQVTHGWWLLMHLDCGCIISRHKCFGDGLGWSGRFSGGGTNVAICNSPCREKCVVEGEEGVHVVSGTCSQWGGGGDGIVIGVGHRWRVGTGGQRGSHIHTHTEVNG